MVVNGLGGVAGFSVGLGMKTHMGLQGIYGLPRLVCRSREAGTWVALVCKSHGVSI